MRHDGLKRIGWACLSAILRWISRRSGRAAGWLLTLAEAAMEAADVSDLNALPDPREQPDISK